MLPTKRKTIMEILQEALPSCPSQSRNPRPTLSTSVLLLANDPNPLLTPTTLEADLAATARDGAQALLQLAPQHLPHCIHAKRRALEPTRHRDPFASREGKPLPTVPRPLPLTLPSHPQCHPYPSSVHQITNPRTHSPSPRPKRKQPGNGSPPRRASSPRPARRGRTYNTTRQRANGSVNGAIRARIRRLIASDSRGG